MYQMKPLSSQLGKFRLEKKESKFNLALMTGTICHKFWLKFQWECVVWSCQSNWSIFFKRYPAAHTYLVDLDEELIQENPMGCIMQGAGVNYYNIRLLVFV